MKYSVENAAQQALALWDKPEDLIAVMQVIISKEKLTRYQRNGHLMNPATMQLKQ
jgi:hypothetical protein